MQNLLKRGVRIRAVVACGITSQGPWRSSKTPGIQQALSNAFRTIMNESEGLYLLRDGRFAVHYPK